MKPTSLWRQILRQNFTRPDALADFLELSPSLRAQLLERPAFPLQLPQRLARKIAKNTLDDPILRQYVPLAEETRSAEGFTPDPLADQTFRRGKKLLQKYENRALILTTSACAMHCRFCFRQNFPYETAPTDFREELDYLKARPDLHEVILSGGDPLSLSDEALARLFSELARIPHLKRIRFHTRFPIGIPERIDPFFLEILASSQQQIVFIIHANHPLELDPEVMAALAQIQRLGIPVLNQSVLLKGVNDDEATLLSLCEKMIDQGILPYYLHVLDRVAGAAHFEVPLERATELVAHLHARLSGYGVPRLVREEPGKPGKTLYPIPSL